jgi:hypothetical protein
MIVMCKKRYIIRSRTSVPVTPDDALHLRPLRFHFGDVIYEVFIIHDGQLVFVGELKAPPAVAAIKCLRPDPLFVPVVLGFEKPDLKHGAGCAATIDGRNSQDQA